MPDDDVISLPPRRFLAWYRPGEPEPIGRVELLASVGMGAPERHYVRTAEDVAIPAGSILRYVETTDG